VSEQGGAISATSATSYPVPTGTSGFGYGPRMGCAPDGQECAAVAASYSPSHPGLFLLSGEGTRWTVEKAPLPAGTVPAQVNLVGAFCPSGGPCVAMSDYLSAGKYRQISWTKG
jgi:hypothetical protein